MCAVIGTSLTNPSIEDLDMVRNLFLESRIRGLHATGLSYVKQGKVVTLREAVSAKHFSALPRLEEFINEDGNLYLIGHCRYSTSDLNYNQPIQISDDLAIAHNGVVTQELPENWESMYGYKTQGKNDSELLNLTIQDSLDPLFVWKDSSLSVIELHADKRVKYYRNGKRPLYGTDTPNGYIITSTRDIAKRAGITYEPKRVECKEKDLQPLFS